MDGFYPNHYNPGKDNKEQWQNGVGSKKEGAHG
jgi:hypothetical protein